MAKKHKPCRTDEGIKKPPTYNFRNGKRNIVKEEVKIMKQSENI